MKELESGYLSKNVIKRQLYRIWNVIWVISRIINYNTSDKFHRLRCNPIREVELEKREEEEGKEDD